MLIFVARKLVRSDDPNRRQLGGEILKVAADRAMPRGSLAHLLFTLTGNQVDRVIQNDLRGTDGSRPQHSVNLRIPDHGDFVEAVYEEACKEAGSRGNS